MASRGKAEPYDFENDMLRHAKGEETAKIEMTGAMTALYNRRRSLDKRRDPERPNGNLGAPCAATSAGSGAGLGEIQAYLAGAPKSRGFMGWCMIAVV